MAEQTAQDALDKAVEGALEYFDQDNRAGALAAFVSETSKHPGTEHIPKHPMTLLILMNGYAQGRRAFEESMRGFAIKTTA
jgi:hypothetical protein